MSTVKELQKELDDRGVAYDAKAKKADLEKLVADNAVADPTDTAPPAEDVAADPHEGPTELGDPDHNPEPIPDIADDPDVAPAPEGFEEPKKGDLVVTDPIRHEGKVYPVGVAAPKSLSDDQVERLTRLGCLAKQD